MPGPHQPVVEPPETSSTADSVTVTSLKTINATKDVLFAEPIKTNVVNTSPVSESGSGYIIAKALTDVDGTSTTLYNNTASGQMIGKTILSLQSNL